MKRLILPLVVVAFSTASFAQNVGIGATSFTPNADALLELRSTSSGFLMPRMTESERDAISSPNEGLMIYQTNNTPGYRYYDGSAWIPFGAGAADNFGDHVANQNIVLGDGLGIVDEDLDTKIQVEESDDDDHIRFDVEGVEAMLIDNAQNVGIGTSSPSEKLHVEGNVRIGAAAYLDDDGTAGGHNDDWIRLNGYVEMKSNSDNYGLILRDKDNNDYANLVQKNGSTYLSDSNVSGNYFLRGDGANAEVRGDLNVMGSDVYDSSGPMRLSGEDDVFITMDHNSNDNDNRAIRFGKNSMTSPTELMRIQENGEVGIGTNNPGANLHVRGNATSGFTPGFGGAGPELAFSRGGFYKPAATIQMVDYNGYSSGLCFNVHRGVNYGGGGAFADNWPTDVIQAMTINNRGDVGIGSVDPSQPLHVQVDNLGMNFPIFVRNKNGTIGSDNGVGIGFNTESAGNWMKAGIFHERTSNFGRGDLHFLVNNSANSSSVTMADAKMTVRANGNVGIGTTTPQAQLNTTGSVRMNTLAGTGTRMVVADAQGDLSTQAIPGGGGGGSITYVERNATNTVSTTSGSWNVINSMTSTPAAGTYLVTMSASGYGNNNGQDMQVALYTGNSKINHSERDYGYDSGGDADDLRFAIHTQAVITVNGSQTISAKYRESGGTFRIKERSLVMMKLN